MPENGIRYNPHIPDRQLFIKERTGFSKILSAIILISNTIFSDTHTE
jgi:hypothetical protein